MDAMGIDIGQIVDLATEVATGGAIRIGEMFADEVFDYAAGVAVMVYLSPPMPGG